MRIAYYGMVALLSLCASAYAVDKKNTTSPSTPNQTPSPAHNMTAFKASMTDTVTLTIDAKNRMQDIIEAYNTLKTEKGSPKVFLMLHSGEKINQIVSLLPTTNQTLLMVRYSTNQGTQLKVVGIEDIVGVTSIP